jgi:peptidoglycan/xylan/chitin deacetylase (PgdA/CDA1 family)
MVKSTLKKFFDFAGANRIGRMLNPHKFRILMYHRFSAADEVLKQPVNIFSKQLEYLKKNYTILSLDKICEYLINGTNLPKNTASITIDDGYSDVYHIAFPILKKFQIPATVFLATDFIEHKFWLWSNKLEYILRNGRIGKFSMVLDKKYDFDVSSFEGWHAAQLKIYNYGRTLSVAHKNQLLEDLAQTLSVEVPDKVAGDFQPISWDQVREMQQEGIDFGSHTSSHEILSQLSSHDIEREIRDSKHLIEQNLDRQITTFCYPNGTIEDYTEETISLLKIHGYHGAVTTLGGLNFKGTDRFQLKRLGGGNNFDYFKRKMAFG